jgi:hypothetical protein
MRHSLIALLLLSLLLSPARGQTGPQLTQSVVAGGGGVSTQGSLRVEGTVGQSSAGASGGGTYTLYGGFFAPAKGPSVLTVSRASANPATQNSSVSYAVTFDEPVTGVDATDFQLTTAGLTGAAVTGVAGVGASYSVTVDTGTPTSATGTLRLDVIDDDTVSDSGGDQLGGAGAGNGDFTSGDVYTVEAVSARVNDARVSEPSAGTAPLLFTVSLSAPAPAGGLSVGYATAGGGATPATGGAACGGAADYEEASGTLSFSAGERFKAVSVNVCADADAGETAETLLLNLSSPTLGIIADAQATGTIAQVNPAGAFLISELRTSGPGGAGDDFVELYNNTDSTLTVQASDGSAGYGLYKMGAACGDAPVLIATVPNGTVIPARGHYLLGGSQYSLKDYGRADEALPDQALTSDIEPDRNVAVFSTANILNISSANRLDAVGFGANFNSVAVAAPEAAAPWPGTRVTPKGVRADEASAAGANGVCDLLHEGNNLPAVSGTTAEHSFFRKECDFVGGVGCTTPGIPKDTNDNLSDFMFADTVATNIAGVPRRLGAPSPEGLTSPIRRDTSGLGLLLLDGTKSASVVPNRDRDTSTGNPSYSTFGTMTIRRRVVNNTGGDVTRLRFRIVELTTYPSPSGTADLRALTGSDEASVGPVGDAVTCGGSAPCTVAVQRTTLEAPPTQAAGGGVNSTLAAGTITLANPLTSGSSLNVNFKLGVQQTGTFRFLIIIEALP